MPLSSQDNRLLVPFLSAWDLEAAIKLTDLVDQLLRAGSSGVLIHGGSGSGKTRVLKNLKQLLQDGGAMVLGPIDMTDYEGESLLREALNDLSARLLEQARETAPSISPLPDDAVNYLPSRISHYVEAGLKELSSVTSSRIVLLLDNYDSVHPLVAVRLAGFLRTWFEGHKAYFTFVLTAGTDLEDLRTTESIYSPLRNICESYLLQDFTEGQMHAYVRERIDWAIPLTQTELKSLWDETLGYPTWVSAILTEMENISSESPSLNRVEEAKKQCLRQYTRYEPLRTAIRHIEYLANMTPPELNPAKTLDTLRRGHRLNPQEHADAARLLLAMGILGWRGRYSLTWRNPMVQTFFGGAQNAEAERLGEVGRRMIDNWLKRPVLFRDGQLSAQGKVLVSLFIDLGPLLSMETQHEFDLRRGTDEWRNRLLELRQNLPPGSFSLWKDQERLINTGNDLNLFREQSQRSFMPIYEAKTDTRLLKIDWDRTLSRLTQLPDETRNKAVDVLKQEWTRWQQVRVQLTRDGAAHITLVRAMDSPLPLMQLLDELLGLERELSSNNHALHLRQLSVQWEIALAVLDAFFRQIGGLAADQPIIPHEASGSGRLPATAIDIPLLDLKWNGLGKRTQEEAGPLYPQRDRYVVFMLRKLCNCRAGGLRPPEDRRLITLEEDLSSLFRDPPEIWSATEASYGREIACLLEGVMIKEPNTTVPHETSSENGSEQEFTPDTGRFPPLKSREIQQMLCKDLASWQNELFVASLDNAIIIYQSVQKLSLSPASHQSNEKADLVCLVCRGWEKDTIEHLYFPQRTVAYDDYWQCVALGLQYVIELRWATQWVAHRITMDLAALANLMAQDIARRKGKSIEALRHSLALTTRLLSHLRDASDPMSISSTDYAARKYEHVIEVSGLRAKIENAEKNSEAINAFLISHSDQLLQKRAEKLGLSIGLSGAFLAILASFLTLPSMWTDALSLLENFISAFGLAYGIMFAVTMLLLVPLFIFLVIGIATGMIVFTGSGLLWRRRRRISK